ncbi:MAG: DMT family transporter [Paracoccaceae bacterium]
MTYYALTMLLAGIGIPLLAALNAALGVHIGSPAAAAAVLFVVAFSVAATATVITGPKPLLLVASAPKHLFLAGALIAFYVLSITFIAPHFGIGNAVFFVLLGQMISAAIIDQFGLFGSQGASLTVTRTAGIAMMAGGVWLTQRG